MMKHRFFLLAPLLYLTMAMGQKPCEPCNDEARNAEYQRMVSAYQQAVQTANNNGYQCGNMSNYSDPGLGLHSRPGNCADWAYTSWSSLVRTTWQCWNVVKIRARRKFYPQHHNFIYVQPKCGGTRVYFDPWYTGRPDRWDEDQFPFPGGFTGGWIHYPLERHNAGDAPKSP